MLSDPETSAPVLEDGRPTSEAGGRAMTLDLERARPVPLAVVAILLGLLVPTAAFAQQQHQTFRDANGRTLGRSSTDSRGNTTFYDAMGRRNRQSP